MDFVDEINKENGVDSGIHHISNSPRFDSIGRDNESSKSPISPNRGKSTVADLEKQIKVLKRAKDVTMTKYLHYKVKAEKD